MSVRYEVDGPVVIVTIARPQARNAVDVLNQWGMSLDQAMKVEYRGGLEVIASGEAQRGAGEFAEGKGRHGE